MQYLTIKKTGSRSEFDTPKNWPPIVYRNSCAYAGIFLAHSSTLVTAGVYLLICLNYMSINVEFEVLMFFKLNFLN